MRKLVGENKGSCRNKSGGRSTTDTSDVISGREDMQWGSQGLLYFLLRWPSADADQRMKSLRLCFAIELENRRIGVTN